MKQGTVEITLSRLLRWGVLGAGILVFIGGAFYLIRHGSTPVSYQDFKSAAPLWHVSLIFSGLLKGRTVSLIQLGLFVLILTPIARVAAAAVLFAMEKDGLYVAISLLVLGLLLASFCGGLTHL